MNTDDKEVSRRNFIRTMAATSLIPLVHSVVRGQETTVTASFAEPPTDGLHRIVTANILATLSEHDGTPVDWETRRKDVCFKVLKDQQAHIICLQEVLRSQLKDFEAGFPEFQKFGYEGPYMDTNPRRFQGIKNVIMFSRERYELTSAGTYALSETPLIEGSTGWGEKLGRHVNWVRLKDKKTGREFRVINTHFAVRNLISQRESVKIINAESAQYGADFPQFLAGDLNARDTSPTIQLVKEAGWKDTFVTAKSQLNDDLTTDPSVLTKPSQDAFDARIDWIFYRGKVQPVSGKLINEKIGDVRPSDHPFVSADVHV